MPLRGLFNLLSSKVHCPHCHTEATEIRAFLLIQNSVAYCQNCGWNIGKATTKLRIDMWAMWGVAGIGVLLAVTALMRGPYGMRGAVLLPSRSLRCPLVRALLPSTGCPELLRYSRADPVRWHTEQRHPRQHRPQQTKIMMFRWQCDPGLYVSRCVGTFILREWPWPQYSCCGCCLSFCGELQVHGT